MTKPTAQAPINQPPAPAGVAQQLAPDLRLVLAPNPSPMTYWGTNSFLLGRQGLAVIDPGPDDPEHLHALLAAIGTTPVEAILVTHAHLDHSPLAPKLAQETGAPVLAFGGPEAGRSAVMHQLATEGLIGGGEGVDPDFRPHRCLTDGEQVHGTDWQLTALHTPGHFGNHMCFADPQRLFCGDLVMGWASSLVSPPDGDLTDFMASCRRLLGMPQTKFYPAHGAAIEDGPARLEWLIAHRTGREAQILEKLADAAADTKTLTRAIYQDVAPALLPAAERNVLAHMVDLYGRGRVSCNGPLSSRSIFSLS